jgi:regulator of RNase E activity RraA
MYRLWQAAAMIAEDWRQLNTANVSDALDVLGLRGVAGALKPLWGIGRTVAGPAVTVHLTAAGETKGARHLGVEAIAVAPRGAILVIDNGGRLDMSCFGGILATAAALGGIEAVVADGACRDIGDYAELSLPVFARSSAVATARGRVMETATNVVVQLDGVQVRPNDLIVGDASGIVVVPRERLAEALEVALRVKAREDEMIGELRAGRAMAEVDRKYGYEKMLREMRG